MASTRWQQIERLFDEAAAQRPDDVPQWLRERCDDADVRDAVLRLLKADASTGGIVDEFDAARSLDACDPMVGVRLGAFELRERLAAGGMGVVYRAARCDGMFDQEVAVKIVRRELAVPDLLARFESERRTLATLVHPNIARLFDGGTTPDGRPWFALEFVRGVPVDEHCRARRLGVRARLELFRVVCEAVQHAHSRLIVHRDLKPANVLVDGDGVARLVDFGIARPVATAGSANVEVPAYTPGFASPEQLRGDPVTTAVDVFGLGALLRVLLEQSGERVDVDLARIVERATAEDPTARYGSAVELADDVRRHLEGRAVSVRRDEWGYRLWRFVARNRVVVAAALAALLALFVGLWLALAGRAVAEQEARHAGEESESSQELVDFLMDAFLSSDLAADEQQLAAVRQQVLDQAARFRRQNADRPHIRANLLDALGQVAWRLGLDEEALALLEDARDVREHELPDAPLELSRSHLSLGRFHHAHAAFAVAADHLQQGLAIQQLEPRGPHSNVPTFLNDLAACRRALGALDEAERLHREALRLRRADAPGSLPVAESLNNLASVRWAKGDVDEAAELIGQSLAIRRDVLGDEHMLTTQSLSNLAVVQARRGRRAEADELFASAEQAYRRRQVAGEDGLAQVLVNRAVVAREDGRTQDARERLAEALALLRRRLGDGHARVGTALTELARTEEAAGDASRADACWREAIDVLARAGTSADALQRARDEWQAAQQQRAAKAR